MTQATAKITSKLSNTFVRCANRAEKEAVQKSAFQMGFKWASEDREIRIYGGNEPGIIEVDDCYRLTYHFPEGPYRIAEKEVTLTELKDAAAEYMTIKRRENKASKKRRALRKWDATATKRTHDACPVDKEVIVSVRFVDGDVMTRKAGGFDWSTRSEPWMVGSNIVSYKVIGYPKATKEASADEGWIEWNSGPDFKWGHGTPGWYGPVSAGVMLDVKQRNGEITRNVEAGMYIARGAFWNTENHENDIVAYRLVKPATVTQEEMVAGIAADMSKELAVPVGFLTSEAIRNAADTVLEVRREPIADTNPKRQYGVASVPLNMWSPLASAYGALGLYNGSLKYGKANFANTPVEASIYIAAAMRHLSAWASGQEDDPADGVPNLGGVLANIAILLEARAAGMLIDDRLKMQGYLKEIEMLKAKVKALNELHAGKNPKHYTLEAK